LRRRGGSQFREEFARELLGGVLVLKHPGAVNAKAASGLYQQYSAETPATRPVELKFIPYYAWANRSETAMQVWTAVLRA